MDRTSPRVVLKAGTAPAARSCAHRSRHHLRSALRLSSSDIGAPVFLSPFRTGASHVVQFGPVGLEKRVTKPAPPPSCCFAVAPRSRDREQHFSDIQNRKMYPFRTSLWVGLAHWFPAARFFRLIDLLSVMLVRSVLQLHSTQVDPRHELVYRRVLRLLCASPVHRWLRHSCSAVCVSCRVPGDCKRSGAEIDMFVYPEIHARRPARQQFMLRRSLKCPNLCRSRPDGSILCKRAKTTMFIYVAHQAIYCISCSVVTLRYCLAHPSTLAL